MFQRRLPAMTRRVFSTAAARPLTEIPGPLRLPFIGSFWDVMRRGGPSKLPRIYQEYYQKYGPIVLTDTFGEKDVLLYDPRDYMAVFHKEGKYPLTVAVEFGWPFAKYFEDRGQPLALSATDHTWLDVRRKLQQDIFGPAAADAFLPHINEVLDESSALAPGYKDDFGSFCARLSFDMFSRLVIGTKMRTLLRQVPENEQFIEDATDAMKLNAELAYVPWERTRPGKVWRKFEAVYDRVIKRSEYFLEQTKAEFAKENSDPLLHETYFAKLIKRGQLTQQEIVQQIVLLLNVGIDTTTHTLQWNIIQLAANPDKQDKLFDEIRRCGNVFTAETRDNYRYLHQCMRESYRLTPVGPLMTSRKLPTDVEIKGYTIPAGTRCFIANEAMQKDPKICPDPEKYLPERWDEAEVNSRKGTVSGDVLDNKIVSKPFGFGPRMCLGSRVADREIACALVRLFGDWRITFDPPDQQYEVVLQQMTSPSPWPRLKFESRA